ncbi:co-chaperone GroES [Bdellovibrio sp. HCB337]|uniref:co-chaperone GroES n=1 Tax=Bdellovibrio sp. HCB337 TaxID=3394358 RepID=UPI0039A4D497
MAKGKKSVKKKPAAKKPVKKAVAKKTPAKKAPAKKAVAKKAAPKKAAAKKPVVKTKAKAKSTKPAPKKVSAIKSAPAVVVKPTKTIDLSSFVTPLDDRVMVQLTGAEKMTAGGLYIPDTVADVSGNLQGFVVSVGRGHRNKKGHVRPMDLKVGDKVLFSEYTGSKIKIQNQDLLIIREGDVLGVVG